MKRAPIVSVVMPVYNSKQFLKEAINSILCQSHDNFEFIIIDDGSTDGSSSLVQSYNDHRIRYYRHEHNLGIVAALNKGLSLSRGKYIARMDADDISDTTRLSKQAKFMDEHPDYAAVGSFVRILDENGIEQFTIENPTRDIAIKKFMLQNSCIAHGSVMLRSEAVNNIGGYSNNYRVRHAEDYDLFVRLGKSHKLANIPEYLYSRHEHHSSISRLHSLEQSRAAKYIASQAKKILNVSEIPKISVVMPNYNKAEYVGHTIDSILSQSFKGWELVIIDDASTDNSDTVIPKYLADKRVVYLKNPCNLGTVKTRVRLAKESVGDIIAELDSDDVIEPNALELIYSEHQKFPKAGLIYSQFEYCDQYLHHRKLGFCRKAREGETNLHNHFATALRTYKRSVYNQTSGYDITLPGAEDMDLIYKLEEVAPIHFVDRVLYKYRLTPGRSKRANRRGTISHIKAKIYAFIRRKHNGYPNITYTSLIRQIVNLVLSNFL